jgi:hypothetical protein
MHNNFEKVQISKLKPKTSHSFAPLTMGKYGGNTGTEIKRDLA